MGTLAERLQVDMAEAFTVLRGGARSYRRLSEPPQATVDRSEQIPPATATSPTG
jgi:hypothetical protein